MEFIAELGLNHNGNFGLIPELIRQAAYSGADFAKFQLGWRDGENEINSLGCEEIKMIYRYCDKFSIEPLFSVFNEKSWNLLRSVGAVEVVKIASRTYANDKNLVSTIAEKVNRTIISTGMVDKQNYRSSNISNAEYLWCESQYPLHHYKINDFPSSYSKESFVGISDHTQDLSLAFIAISRGAMLIERHFTLDKSNTTIRDHALSSTPDEFLNLTRTGREIFSTLNALSDSYI